MMIRIGFDVVVVLVDVLGGDGREVTEGGGEDVGTDLAEVELAHKHGFPPKKITKNSNRSRFMGSGGR